MSILTTEIAPNVYRIRIAPSDRFEFNHFLCIGERSCLIHCGKRSYFKDLHQEVARLLDGRNLDTIVFSHYEADECGSINDWLTAFPASTTVCNKIADISLDDMILRPAEVIEDGEIIVLGGLDLELVETPHFPHNWDAHLWFEHTNGILFSSDFCIMGGICEPITDNDMSQAIITYYEAGNFMPSGPTTNAALDKLGQLPIKIIAPMHGSTIKGQGAIDTLTHVTQNLKTKA